MKKIKEILKNKKIVIPILCLIACGIVAIIIFGRFEGSQEKKLTSKLQEMGKDFYENFYYQQVGSTNEERIKFLKKFETIGIKVNLDNLSRYNLKDSEQVLSQFVNKKNNTNCDKTNTQVIIYPVEPYNQDSYNLEVHLECGF